jgi:hypothetical protein
MPLLDVDVDVAKDLFELNVFSISVSHKPLHPF